MNTDWKGPRYSIEFSQEEIRSTTLGRHELAPGWRYVDDAGHVHAGYDSLEWVGTSTYWCDTCRDEHEEGEYRCRLCAEVVEPEYVFTGPQAEVVPGLRTVTLRLDDGRAWFLSGDEAEVPSWPPPEEWVARVTARPPDEVVDEGERAW